MKMSSLALSHLLFTYSYELQEEGPVQQISYVSDSERGYLRIVSEDEMDYLRWVFKSRHGVPLKPTHKSFTNPSSTKYNLLDCCSTKTQLY